MAWQTISVARTSGTLCDEARRVVGAAGRGFVDFGVLLRGRRAGAGGDEARRGSEVNISLAVNGTLMRGLELNGNMLAAGARFVREATTAPEYRLWSIGDRHPAMMRVREGGAAIAVEVWDVPAAGLGQILLQEPPGLCIGKVRLGPRMRSIVGTG